ncbi:MAG: tyrosine-protein phosphatase [Gammaproteobacteria bacterium]|nr:tyrosine-protein phosphatase [Gammaproteobacteria bacterium]
MTHNSTPYHIPLDGTPNLRDLGGYATRCGRHVATGKAFRSGTLAYLSAADWQQLANFNLRYICDFRREEEQTVEPTSPPATMPVDIVPLSIGAGSLNDYLRYVLTDANESAATVRQLMRSINRELVLEYADIYSRFLRYALALKNDEAMLFHCAAGKDRTGFGAALLLSALNVDRETILRDYLASATYFVPELELEKIKQRYPPLNNSEYDLARLQPMLEVQPEYINAAFHAIDEQWGDTETYINQALQVTDAELQALRDKFLHPGDNSTNA